MKENLIEFMSERYGWTKEEILNAENFETLDLDSLSLYALVTDTEEKFGVKIETDDMTEIDTPKKFIDYILRIAE